MLGINGPDDFIQGGHHFARAVTNLARVFARFIGTERGVLRQCAAEADLHQTRAQIIVQVLRDAGPLTFQGLLLFEAFEFAPVAVPDCQQNSAAQQTGGQQGSSHPEPRRLPQSRLHRERQ